MSSATLPAAFKNLKSALMRAEELDKNPARESRILGYFCRMFVATRAARQAKTPEERKFFEDQLGLLERIKPGLSLSSDEGPRVCTEQAILVFNKADEIDRNGLADKATVKLFYSAGTFFEILEQFGPLDPEIVEKRKYAKWKATEILNAINAGEVPVPGCYGEVAVPNDDAQNVSAAPVTFSPTMQSLSVPQATLQTTFTQNAHEIPSAPSASVFGRLPTAPNVASPAPLTNHYGNLSNVASSAAKRPPVNTNDPRVKDTIELCTFAIADLKHNDVSKAREKLQEALRRLG
jgi:hypothetical protein